MIMQKKCFTDFNSILFPKDQKQLTTISDFKTTNKKTKKGLNYYFKKQEQKAKSQELG